MRLRSAKELKKQLREFLHQVTGGETHLSRIRTWALGQSTAAFVLPQGLAVKDGEWFLLPWHHILKGGWHPEEKELWWEMLDRSNGKVQLDASDTFLTAFQHSVQESILLTQKIVVPNGGKVIISARKPAGTSQKILWHVLGVGKTDLSDPLVAEFVVSQRNRLQAEYGIS